MREKLAAWAKKHRLAVSAWDELVVIVDDYQRVTVLDFQAQMADELLAWAKDTRAAWLEHNRDRLQTTIEGEDVEIVALAAAITKPERRPDLRSTADGIEMAAHAVRRGHVPEEVARRIARRREM